MRKTKPYWKMTAAELRKATREFDDPAYQPPALPLSEADRAQQRRARTRTRRPDTEAKATTISLTVEKALLARSDSYARRLGISRSELVRRGLLAVLPPIGESAKKRAG